VLDRKPWKLWEAALLISPFVLSIVVAQFAQSQIPANAPPPVFSLGNFLLNSVVFLAYAACAVGILMSKYELSLDAVLGLKKGPLAQLLPTAFFIGFAIVPLMFILQMGCNLFFKSMGIAVEAQKSIQTLKSMDTPFQILLFSLMPVIQAPLVEEILFRGILFPSLRISVPRWVAYCAPAFLFSAVHLSLLNALPLFALALLLTWQYEKTGNLLCPVLTHAGFNLCNVLLARGIIPLEKIIPPS
tara:strand:- start:61 stop:792 length:732 start_codon:yes stop_codon:yes gene_type:complete